jgi:hypothetical protein
MERFMVAGIGIGCLLLAGIASAQVAISAKSGMINYVEGTVLLDDQAVEIRSGSSFPQVQAGSDLRTEEGRAEVLLGPGVFLRMGENSAVHMVYDDLMDTRVEFVAGSAIVETADMVKNQALTFTLNGAVLGLRNNGLYRLDAEPPQISVYAGEVSATVGGQTQILTRGRRLLLDGVAVAEKFDTKTGDALFSWARRRSEYLAVANVSAARSAQASGFLGTSAWVWNPFYGSYTFLPMSGFYSNFWGCQFYSPGTVYLGYAPFQLYPPAPRPVSGTPPKNWRFGPPVLPGHLGKTPAPDVAAGHGSSGGSGRWAAFAHSGGYGYSGSGRSSGGGYSGGGHSSGGGFSGGGYSGGGGHASGGGGSVGGGVSSAGGGRGR